MGTIHINGISFTPQTDSDLSANIIGGTNTGTSTDVERLFNSGFGGNSNPTTNQIDPSTPGQTNITQDSSVQIPGGQQVIQEIQNQINQEIGNTVFRDPQAQQDFVAMINEQSRYVGYVIFKEKYNEEEDLWIPVDVFVIPNVDTSTYNDTKVNYSGLFRYKIRSLCKFINRNNLPIYSDHDSTLSRAVEDAVFKDGAALYSGYYFDSEYSDPVEIVAVDTRKPNPPSNISIYPDSIKKQILVIWNQKNQNRDVAGFNVYRKEDSKDSLFSQLNSNLISIRNNYFVDKSAEYDKNYIYTIEAVDVHDNRSALSIQYKISLREQNIEVGRIENKTKFYAPEGLQLEDIYSITTKKVNELNKSFSVIINPLFVNLHEDSTFLFRITSLDTFMKKEIKLNFDIKVINHVSS